MLDRAHPERLGDGLPLGSIAESFHLRRYRPVTSESWSATNKPPNVKQFGRILRYRTIVRAYTSRSVKSKSRVLEGAARLYAAGQAPVGLAGRRRRRRPCLSEVARHARSDAAPPRPPLETPELENHAAEEREPAALYQHWNLLEKPLFDTVVRLVLGR